MKIFEFTLVITVVAFTESTFVHKIFQIRACSDTEKEDVMTLDEEEMFHSDFNREQGVVTLPDFSDSVTFNGLYKISVGEMKTCKINLAIFSEAYKYPKEQIDPPQTSIYTKDDVILDAENTLVCHVTGFFPPPITISWTKNDLPATENTKFSQYRPNSDGTYNIFSSLKFSPAEGDVYACTVHHKSSQEPQTKLLVVDAVAPGVGPSVFCGVGLLVGLLGVTSGTFTLIKRINCRQ